MRTSQTERIRAEQISAEVDHLLREPDAEPEHLEVEDLELLDTARQLAQLPALLGPVDPILEQQVMHRVQAATGPSRQGRRLRWGLAVTGLATVLFLVVLLTPLGQTAVASFMAVFHLGRTEVRIAPVYTPSAIPVTATAAAGAVRESLTLEQATAKVSFAIPQPAYVPPGYQLEDVINYTYPDLPAWEPQPLFLELVYGDQHGEELILRVYPIMLGDQASISGLNLQATSIQDVQDVDVNGRPGALMRLGTERTEVVWQEVVWEQSDLILALSSDRLPEDELLRIARSVR
jgi:hypothetical protein